MILIWVYMIIGAVLAALAMLGLRSGERNGRPDREARLVVDRIGAPAVIAAIVLFWPALAWFAWGKK